MFSGAIKASKGSGAASTTVNPPFNTVVALLHADGTNGQLNYPLTDTSTTPLALSGSATTGVTPFMQGTFGPFKSAYSVDCRSSTSPIFTIPFNTALAMGTGNFTIEFWVQPYSTGAVKCIFDIHDGGSAGRLGVRLTTSNQITLNGGTGLGTVIATSAALSLNTWSHVAIVRSGTGTNQCTIYVNGASSATGTSATSFTCTTGYVYLCGQGPTPSFYTDGLLSQLRVVKGVAVYTGTFTVPTSVLNATQSANPYGGSNTAAITGSQTSLLTFVRPYFVDLSANALSMFRGNTGANTSQYPWFVAQSPIPNATINAPTTVAEWSASAFGGSYGNARTATNTLNTSTSSALALGSTGDFTIEFWCYSMATSVRQDYLDFNTGGSSARIDIYIHPTTFCMNVYAANTDYFTQTTAAKDVALIGTWSHFALTRTGTTTSFFWNGKRIGTSTVTVPVNTASPGAQISGPDGSISGLVAGARIVKGTSLYDATLTTYTVPTAPFTAVSGTGMLVNASTNAPMIDYSMNQTFFNGSSAPTVSTTQVKYGTASLSTASAFLPSQSLIGNSSVTFGTGNFTVEGWFYANSGTSNSGIFQIAFTSAGNGAGQTGLALAYYTVTNLRLYYGAASVATGTAGKVTTGAWTHFAVVRNGTGASNLKVYINGVADTALTVTDSYNYPLSYLAVGTYGTSLTWTGYIDEFRVSKYAVYTSDFTVPNTAFANT